MGRRIPVLLAIIVTALAGFVTEPSLAQSQSPGAQAVPVPTAPTPQDMSRFVPPSQAVTTSQTLPSSITNPPEIVELARALKNNPDLIYEYVYNNIETLPQYASVKGPLGALLDRKGTAFDQAELMIRLLQIAGYSDAQFEIGYINLSKDQLTQWLGTDTSYNSNYAALAWGGFAFNMVGGSASDNSVSISGAQVSSAWVRVTIGGQSVAFDPSTKGYRWTTSTWWTPTNLAATLGYSQSTLLSQAETNASITSTSIANLNRNSVRNNLAGYANNLIRYVHQTLPSGSTQDLIGGKTIIPLPLNTQLRQNQLPNLNVVACVNAPCDTNNLSSYYRTTIAITLPTNVSPVTFNSSDIYGHRLSVFFDASNEPVLYLDGVQQAKGTAQPANTTVPIGISIARPLYITKDANGNPVAFANQTGTLNVVSGGTYVIMNGWGSAGRGLIERHRKILQQNLANAPGAYTNEEVLGESLALMGQTWLAETSRTTAIADQLGGVSTTIHDEVGIVGIRQSGLNQGPYFDVQIAFEAPVQRSGRPNTLALTPTETTAFFAHLTPLNSAIESGTIEQTQSGAIAASTVKLLDTWSSQPGQIIYDINYNPVTNEGCTYYVNNIRGHLTGYSTSLTAIDNAVLYNGSSCGTGTPTNPSYRVIAPSNGLIRINQFVGSGFYELSQDNACCNAGSLIGGGFGGGLPATSIPTPQLDQNTVASTQPGSASATTTIPGVSAGGSSLTTGSVGDPVNRVTGDFLVSHDDLTTGSGAFPYSLVFQRSYDSGQRLQSGPLGLGWTHNFAISALKSSDGLAGMGGESPISGAAAIAAIYVIQDILNVSSGPSKPLDRLVIAAQAGQWLMEQLNGNVVLVTQPGTIEQFVKTWDGNFNTVYNPPLGSATILTQNSDGTYSYTTKDQTKLSFNSAGNLFTWMDPAGVSITLAYNGNNQLTTVSNNLGRTLTLGYSGTAIGCVQEGPGTCGQGAARYVAYLLDGNNNLSIVSDPLRFITKYTYDNPGRLYQIFDPANQLNPYASSGQTTPFITNSYDSLGRISSQGDANDHITNFYFGGTRTEIDDPAGNPRVLYFSARGKMLADIDGLGNKTINTYDALDRLTTTTLPEGTPPTLCTGPSTPAGCPAAFSSSTYLCGADCTQYGYDLNHNVVVITKTPKSSSQDLNNQLLQPIAISYTYDPLYNHVLTSTDGRRKVTSYSYTCPTSNNYQGCGLISTTTYPAVPRPNAPSAAPVESRYYNGLGQLTDVVDPENRRTHYDYTADGYSNLNAVTQDYQGTLNLKTIYGYGNNAGDVTSITDARNHTKTFNYDASRRLTKTYPNDLLNNITDYGYDADNRLTTVTKEYWNGCSAACQLETTTTSYTKSGKVYTITDPNGAAILYGYDANDRVSFTLLSSGRLAQYYYDADSRISTINDTVFGQLDQSITNVGPTQREARTYTPDGLLSTSKDPNLNTTIYVYDGFNRLQESQYADGAFDGVAYDANGNPTTLWTRAAGPPAQGITLSYDDLNRLQSKAIPGVTTYTYGYDYSGRMLQAQASSGLDGGLYTFTYDTAGRLQMETRPAIGSAPAVTVTYGLDQNDNRTSVSSSDSNYSITRVYDPVNQLIDVYAGVGTTGYHYVHYDYNSLFQRNKANYGNGTQTLYGYEPNGLIQSLQHSFAASGGVTFTYTHNTENGVKGLQVSDSSYAPAGTNPEWWGSPQHNYTPNSLNQYRAIDGANISYDVNGNLTGDGVNTYTYDALNRLVSAAKSGTAVSFTYDPLGRRSSKTVNNVLTVYLSAGNQEIAEYSATGALLHNYIYGPGLDEEVTRGDSPFAQFFSHTDGLGSVVAVTDVNGNVAEKHPTMPFGAGDNISGGPYQFTGRRVDFDTGLYYYRARYYSPSIGRFLSADPIGSGGGLNLYAYVGNDPLNATDPTGLSSDLEMDGAGEDATLAAGGRGSITIRPTTIAAAGGAGRGGGIGGGGGGDSGGGGGAESLAPRAYSVAYSMRLAAESFPGISRAVHYQEANEALLQAMEGDAEFAQGMRDIGITLERTPSGLAPRSPPGGWTWHHAQDPGEMQLVPREQHTSGSAWWNILHPNGTGGYATWGK